MEFKGLTNDIKVEGLDVIKQSLSHTEMYLDKQNEANVLLEFLLNSQTIMVKPRAFHFENDHLVSKFKILIGFENIENCQLDEKLINLIVQAIVDFHNIKINQNNIKTFSYQQFLDFFFHNQEVKDKLLLEKYQMISSQLDQLQSLAKTISHNDLVPGNILHNNDKIMFIDYDYVMLNDKFFDIASFITETCNDDQNAIQLFIKKLIEINYLNENELDLLDLCINYQDLLWTLWANYMFITTNENIYHVIYQEKYSRINSRQAIKHFL
ncbi:phosphotransferase family protein [Spiroplasma culicicola]|uniref:Putative choline kinase n=1 Tax=Spiroplasma culicicola AES-1 TaxID=1276246 RepID=W6A6R4_9MOLU|nr:phosphotransferase [Spiroplasma culicicola]AHI52793.1 putative choline kinase [Spiroplasma culicicola AES-1]